LADISPDRCPVELLQLRKGTRDGDVAVAGEDLDVAVWIVDPQSGLELSGLPAKFEVAKLGKARTVDVQSDARGAVEFLAGQPISAAALACEGIKIIRSGCAFDATANRDK
jgi:hypothetical protein